MDQETQQEIQALVKGVVQARNATSSPELTPPNEAGKPSPPSSVENKRSLVWQDKWLKLERNHPQVNELADTMQFWCFDVVRNRRFMPLLIVTGDNSTAKTHCLKRAAVYLRAVSMFGYESGRWPRPIDVQLFEWSHLAKTKDALVLDSAGEADVLLLDDVGAEPDQYKSGEPIERLRQLLGQREGKFTMLTTNIPPALWTSRWDARVNDRLLRQSRIVTLTLESFQTRATHPDP